MCDTLTNLDSLCAEYGNAIVKNTTEPKQVKELENLITKSLGVLQENGVYAYFLYLAYRKANPIKEQSLALLCHNKIELINSIDGKDHFDKIRELTEDLDKLLFARQLLDQMLIYARYHAKAKGES